jgi:hypothetical protein
LGSAGEDWRRADKLTWRLVGSEPTDHRHPHRTARHAVYHKREA